MRFFFKVLAISIIILLTPFILKWGSLWFFTKEGRLFKEKTIKLENGYLVNIYVQYRFEVYLEYCFEIEKDEKLSFKSPFYRDYSFKNVEANLAKDKIIILKEKDTLSIYSITSEKWIK